MDECKPLTSGPNDIKSVAAISAGNNDEIGQMIADAIEKAGPLHYFPHCLLVVHLYTLSASASSA